MNLLPGLSTEVAVMPYDSSKNAFDLSYTLTDEISMFWFALSGSDIEDILWSLAWSLSLEERCSLSDFETSFGKSIFLNTLLTMQTSWILLCYIKILNNNNWKLINEIFVHFPALTCTPQSLDAKCPLQCHHLQKHSPLFSCQDYWICSYVRIQLMAAGWVESKSKNVWKGKYRESFEHVVLYIDVRF